MHAGRPGWPVRRAALLAGLTLFGYRPAVADPLAVLDDRNTGTAAASAGGQWRFFTDGVMGGVSSGRMTAETVDGRPALCLRGQVRLENNGGFVQMALELPALPERPSGTAAWQGVELDVFGDGRRYGVHLRTTDLWLPWQAWRAPFDAPSRWQTVRLPLARFVGHRVGGRLDPATLRRVGLVAIGEAGEVMLCLGRLALY
jgi:hypothetical protein